jgi:hypothetical protein
LAGSAGAVSVEGVCSTGAVVVVVSGAGVVSAAGWVASVIVHTFR